MIIATIAKTLPNEYLIHPSCATSFLLLSFLLLSFVIRFMNYACPMDIITITNKRSAQKTCI